MTAAVSIGQHGSLVFTMPYVALWSNSTRSRAETRDQENYKSDRYHMTRTGPLPTCTKKWKWSSWFILGMDGILQNSMRVSYDRESCCSRRQCGAATRLHVLSAHGGAYHVPMEPISNLKQPGEGEEASFHSPCLTAATPPYWPPAPAPPPPNPSASIRLTRQNNVPAFIFLHLGDRQAVIMVPPTIPERPVGGITRK